MYQTQLNRLLMAVITINACLIVAGCHRGYYRRQADAEVDRLVREKATDPRWNAIDGSIEIDPQSRMFNPFSKDHPPIPPDDAASHQFMHCVDGKEGYPHWHANGDTDAVENPTWRAYLPFNEEGQVVLTLERAFQLALIHSPDYQQQRETLYRSALNVSLERFGFDSQLFSGYNSFLTTQGRFRTGSSNTLLQNQLGANGGGLTLQRLGITGTNFVVGLANTILFNFAGENNQSATTLIDFSVIQPLLRGAGRERIMESLTQSERTLLANIRQLERFRRGFYLDVAIGRNPGAGPNLGGNFLGSPGAGSFGAGGFYGLLTTQQEIRNQTFNVVQLDGILDQFIEFYENGRLEAPDLKLLQGNLYNQQLSLLRAQVGYQTQLDQFKVQLGLPPDIEVVLDDSLLSQFNLFSDEISQRLLETSELRKNTGEGLNAVAAFFAIESDEEDGDQVGDLAPAQEPVPVDDVVVAVAALKPFLEKALAELEIVRTSDADQIYADLDKLESVRADRVEYLDSLKRRVESGEIEYSIDTSLFDPAEIQTADELRLEMSNPELDNQETVIVNGKEEVPQRSILKRAELLEQELLDTVQSIEQFQEVAPTIAEADLETYLTNSFLQRIPGLLAELNSLPLGMSLIQAYARSNSIEITDIDIDDEQAIRIARCLRRDWMNARASLVDEYRNIEFVADQLEAGLDLVFQGDVGNVGDNPLKLRYETGQLRAGFRFDAPITRLAERNQYRQALIDYQQTRRQFYQFEDAIKSNLRNLVRNGDQSKISFEILRRQVQTQIDNVEANRLALEQPVGIGATDSGVGPQTARNLTDAIINLSGAQNGFINSWVQYEVIRRNLDFDMGTMQLDETGQWIDPGVIDESIGIRAAAAMGIQLDCQFCENIGTSYRTFSEDNEVGDSVLSEEIKDAGSSRSGTVNAFELYRREGNPRPTGGDGEMTPEQRALELERQRQELDRRLREDQLRREQLQRELERDNQSLPLEGNQTGRQGPPRVPEATPAGRPIQSPSVGPVTQQGSVVWNSEDSLAKGQRSPGQQNVSTANMKTASKPRSSTAIGLANYVAESQAASTPADAKRGDVDHPDTGSVDNGQRPANVFQLLESGPAQIGSPPPGLGSMPSVGSMATEVRSSRFHAPRTPTTSNAGTQKTDQPGSSRLPGLLDRLQ